MKKPRIPRLFLSVMLLTGAPPTPSFARAFDPVHELTGVTTFTASETSATVIRFPRAVDFLKDFHASYDGDGRVTGFIMRKRGRYEQEGYRPVIVNTTIGQCKKRGCDARDMNFSFTVCFCDDRLLSGTWELYVIADGAPVRLTIKNDNLEGRTSHYVTGDVTSQIQTLDPRIEERNTRTVFSAGDFTELKQADFGMVGLWVVGNPHAATAVGDCLYYDGSDFGYPNVHPPEEVAFMPGCPTGNGDAFPYVDPDGGRGGVISTTASFCCPVGVGGWYTTAAQVNRYGAVAFWIDF